MGWEDIALQIGQIAGPVLGGVLGNRAANQGVTQGRQDIQQAMGQANQYMQNYVQNAKPLLDWYIQQSTALPQWAYNQGLGGLNYGMGQAFNARNQGLNNALAQMQSGFGQGQQFLSPYATIGQNALSTLSQHVLKRPQAGASLPSGRFPTPTASPGFTPFQGAAPPNPLAGGLPSFNANTTGGTALSSMMGGGGLSSVQPQQFNRGVESLLNWAVPGLGSLTGHFTRKGREKETASSAANTLGTDIENAYQQYKSGSMTGDQFQAAVKAWWNEYVTLLSDQTKFKDSDVVAKSLASQAGFINQSMAQKGFPGFNVSSIEGNKWAAGGNAY